MGARFAVNIFQHVYIFYTYCNVCFWARVRVRVRVRESERVCVRERERERVRERVCASVRV